MKCITTNAGLRVRERQTIHPSISASSHVEISGHYVTGVGLGVYALSDLSGN